MTTLDEHLAKLSPERRAKIDKRAGELILEEKKRRKRAPVKAGEILKEEFLVPLGISQNAFARHIGRSRQLVSNIVRGKSAISAETALLFADAFGTSPEFWLNLQRETDLWKAQRRHRVIVPLSPG